MLSALIAKLPMRNQSVTRDYYINKLGFTTVGTGCYPEYLMLMKDGLELHFFLFTDLHPKENYGQLYLRTNDIDAFYQWVQQQAVAIHPAGKLQLKPWGQKEFSLLDPDNNLLTFGEGT